MCRIFICGTYKTQQIYKSEENTILTDVVCPFCFYRGDTIYRRNVKYFTFCFIPLCKLTKTEPYLSCFSCNRVFGYNNTQVCSTCRTVLPNGYNYCTNCGKKGDILQISEGGGN